MGWLKELGEVVGLGFWAVEEGGAMGCEAGPQRVPNASRTPACPDEGEALEAMAQSPSPARQSQPARVTGQARPPRGADAAVDGVGVWIAQQIPQLGQEGLRDRIGHGGSNGSQEGFPRPDRAYRL